MKITELSRPNSLKNATELLDKIGYKPIGYGSYSTVYHKEGTDYVLKIFKCNDSAYLEYIKLTFSHPNIHFPKFKNKIIRLNHLYYAIRMEILKPVPLTVGTFEEYFRLRVDNARSFDPSTENRISNLEVKIEPSMIEAMNLIIDNIILKNSEYYPDLHYDNVMMRDNVMVITDPITQK